MGLKEKIESLEQQMTALQNQIEVLKEDAKEEGIKHWNPEHDELFYYIGETSEVVSSRRFGDIRHDGIVGWLNAYKTQEEAEFWAERLKVFRELSLFALEQVPDSSEYEAVYTITYDRCEDGFFITFRYTTAPSPLVFGSEEIARQAINYVGEERLKKYWFRVGGR